MYKIIITEGKPYQIIAVDLDELKTVLTNLKAEGIFEFDLYEDEKELNDMAIETMLYEFGLID